VRGARTLRALPTLLRVGVAETVAYRAEFFVWILTATMPLVMLGLWTSVTREAPFRGYTAPGMTAYYLSVLIVRNLTSNWAAWQMSEEIRGGTMSMRLLRPIHPFVAIGASQCAALPFRSVLVLPLVAILLASSGAAALSTDYVQLALFPVSLALAWLITFSIQFAIGSLSFWMTQAMALANLYFGLFQLFSGYLLPLDLMPRVVGEVAAWLPFRFMLSMPVQLLTTHLGAAELARLFAGQIAWAAAVVALALWVWRLGVRRFEAVGA
jgi:ABC-2 type transport system permease protein